MASTRAALPAAALPIKQVVTQRSWAPSNGPLNIDVTMIGADGHVYHVWFQAGIGWAGWEDLTSAG